MLPVPTSRARLRVAVAAAGGVVVAGVAGQLAGLAPEWATVLAVVLAAASAAAALPSDVPAPVPVPNPVPAPAAAPPPDVPAHDAQWRSLRHDLRGILSPALLMSDRLLMSTQEPLAKRTAETVIETIERAEKRLSQDSAP